MQRTTLALVITFSLLGCQASSPSEPEFQPLLTIIEQRLDLATSVAVHKWDNHLPVEAPERERQVLVGVQEMAPDYDLSPERAAAFFADQIEANKLIQYTLRDRWTMLGQRPAAAPLDLANQIRPRLDKLQATLLLELARFDRQHNQDCTQKLTHALARLTNDTLRHQALVRATTQLCVER
ncbi:chorismate mutase [Pseudomonas putida]|jgi:chorismate mutase|uniref:chorismate mutase n=1 Tax=Pseudomonas putida TaxID=303 RepID=A0AAP9N434_PSEPU|nr:chorismate mutase [Pseudomonas putida]QJQ13142.1 chorismate mutase [Pseudomonas putida]